MYASPLMEPPKQAAALAPPQHQDENVKGYIASLVVVCNRHVVKFHEYHYNDQAEMSEELFKSPTGNFRSDFEELYRATNLWIGKKRPDIIIKEGRSEYDIHSIFKDVERWIGPCIGDLTDTSIYPDHYSSFYVGQKLFELYLKVLITAELYNPLSI